MKNSLLPMLVFSMLVNGCASIVGSTTQTMSINTTCNGEMVTGATCRLANNHGTYYVLTPGAVVVQKSEFDISITCSKNKVETPTYTFAAGMAGDVWGNLIFGGPIGVAVDAASGAGFNYPLSLTVWWSEDQCQLVRNGN